MTLFAEYRLKRIDGEDKGEFSFSARHRQRFLGVFIGSRTPRTPESFCLSLTFSGKFKYNQMKTDERFVSLLMGNEGP